MAQSIYKILLIIQICLSVKINQVLSKQIVKNVPKNLTKTIEHLQLLRQTIKPQIINSTETTEVIVTKQRPCSCANGLCSCCSRMLLNTWNQKACVNVTYDPDEFSFTTKLLMNDRILYTRTISGKNPRPVCVPMPRIPAIKACVRLYNIYFQGRNVHACVSMEGKLSDTTLFKVIESNISNDVLIK